MSRRSPSQLLVAAAAGALIGLTASAAGAGGGRPCVLVSGPGSGCTAAAAGLVPVAQRRPQPGRRQSYLIAQVRPGTSVPVRSGPGGQIVTSIGSTTEFGSRVALAVVDRRGHWLGIATPALRNGQLGWIDARRVARTRTRLLIEIDLSRRELRLRRGGEAARRFTVSVGGPGSPTPIGRFAVTDKLDGARYSPVYGCCILALSGRQTHLPPGWTGGDRLAIHGSPGGAPLGGAASAGCLHADEDALRLLMRNAPLGTPVVIHP